MKLWRALKGWFIRWIGLEPIRQIIVSKEVVLDVCDMAQSAHPKEMLAYLSASRGVKGGILLIDGLQVQAYDASNDSAHANTWMLPSFSTIVGTVHSHPGGYVRPSDADLNFWNNFGYVHAIIGEPYNPQKMQFYDKEGNKLDVKVAYLKRKGSQ